jgi:hypothetical protein
MRNAYPASWTWWNLRTGWTNKWKNGNPDDGEKFFGSSTFLVWLTDGWHFWQMIYLNCLMIGFWLLPFEGRQWFWVLAFIIGFKIVFEIFYTYLLKPILRKLKLKQ